jgi:two-component system cell cycle sensor histidine kinase/response regulator CckA
MLAYSGKATVLVEPVEIRRLLVDTLEVLPALVPDHVRLVCEGGEALPLVRGDFTQLQQVVLNLALNGAEAITGEAGHVWLRAGLETIAPGYRPSGFLDAELSPGLHAYFEVADDGHGMDEATVRRIFDPFFTTKFTGRGLGLAVVLGIIRGHEGGIRIRTEPGGGTCVRVLLPATALRVPVAATPASADTSAPLSATVLVVDDDRVVREVAVRSLEMIGVDSLTAVDGLDALAVLALRAADIDLVLLDLTMPRMSGEETFQALRAIDPKVRVILSSGYNQHDAASRFGGKGLVGFLQKPYRARDLLDMVALAFSA